jgi:DNA-binding transcriptional LysR family regulator
MINFNQLRIFYQTAKYQNCTIAAKKLFITQSGVTVQVKAFEDFCDLKLFKKIGRKIYLTDEGKSLYEYAKRVFEYEKEIEDAIEDMRVLKKGILRIGTTKTYARAYMPLLISEFWRTYPHIKVNLNEGSSLEMANGLFDLQNEIVIVAKVEDNPQICFVPFCQEEVVVLLSSHHHLAKRTSITMAELAKEPIIMKESGSGTREAINKAFASKGLIPNILMDINNTDFIKQITMRGDGISFLVKAAVSAELDNKELITIKIKDYQIYIDVCIAYLRDQYLSRPAHAFLDILGQMSSSVNNGLCSFRSMVARLAASNE